MSTAVEPQERLASPERKASGWGSRAGLDVTAVFTGYLVFLFAIPSTMIVESLGTLGHPATILSLVSLLWYAWFHLHRSEHIQGGRSPVRAAGIAFALVMFLVYGHAMTTFIPSSEVTNADSSMFRMIGLIGVMLILNDGINSVERCRTLLRRMVIAGMLIAILAIVQFFTGDVWIDRMSLPGLTPPDLLGIGQRNGFFRPNATATNAIEFGAVMAMLLPIAFTNAQTATKHKVLVWVPVVILAFASLVALSRTAILCAGIAMAILVPAWSRRAQIQTMIAAPFLLVGAGLAVPGLLGTLKGMFLGAGEDSSVASRTESYGVAWEYIQRHWLLGRGYNTFLPQYWILDNAYLQFVIGTGIVGTTALLALIWSAVRSAGQAQRTFTQTRDQLMARSLMAAVVAGAVSLLFFDAFSFPQSAGMTMMVLGLAGASLRLARTTTTTSQTLTR
ncbi:O-antigen ligase family protein [Luteococcus sp. Sow4_B9]|uniref:O-antigen ligase family protein n=1 Tax=Luteococcus sp. Sow4_B9 TaxID=3438792 RepID=UPI003F9DF4C9